MIFYSFCKPALLDVCIPFAMLPWLFVSKFPNKGLYKKDQATSMVPVKDLGGKDMATVSSGFSEQLYGHMY